MGLVEVFREMISPVENGNVVLTTEKRLTELRSDFWFEGSKLKSFNVDLKTESGFYFSDEAVQDMFNLIDCPTRFVIQTEDTSFGREMRLSYTNGELVCNRRNKLNNEVLALESSVISPRGVMQTQQLLSNSGIHSLLVELRKGRSASYFNSVRVMGNDYFTQNVGFSQRSLNDWKSVDVSCIEKLDSVLKEHFRFDVEKHSILTVR